MGDVYQFGDMGKPVDLKRAENWYAKAAKADDGSAMIYVPPVGGKGYGSVMPVHIGASPPGDEYAKSRLGQISQSKGRVE
jgi:TPR repeat protein